MSWITSADESAILLDLAQEAAQAGLLEWEFSTGSVKVSAQLLRIYGIEEFDGRYERLNAVVFREDLATITFQLEEAYATHLRDAVIEFRIKRENDEQLRWIESRNLIFYDDDGKPRRLIAVNADVTGRKLASIERRHFMEALEEKVRERTRELEEQNIARIGAEEALRQAQKMEAIGQLTGGVAHDFNNLLTVIKSSADFLRRQGLSEERRARYVDAISTTVDRASKLTSQLLAFARRQALKPEVFDVPHRLRYVVDMLRTVVGSSIVIEMEFDRADCVVEADASQFETALVNLTVNARHAMEAGGTLTIKVTRSLGTPGVPVESRALEEFVAIRVADTGCGIREEILPQIFEPFFTTKGVGKGTGLGLSQVYGFAKQSGGDVAVESKLGVGTSFTVYLPRVDRQVPFNNSASSGEDRTIRAGEGRRVLVVEDNAEVGTFSTQLLNDLGYETTLCTTAHQALRTLKEQPFDVVFSDVVMPGMGGVELGQEIRRLYPELPVILTSGYSEVLAENGQHGFDLLHKPYAVEQLSRIFRRAMRRPRISPLEADTK